MEIVPKTTIERKTPSGDRYVLPTLRADRFQQRERDLVTQTRLLEKLRYKYYVRHGTLGSAIQMLGDVGRSKRARWMLALLVYAYALWMFV